LRSRGQNCDRRCEIKRRSNLQARDRVIIYEDGAVRDERGEELGNIYDET
jgi:hypothetical protein